MDKGIKVLRITDRGRISLVHINVDGFERDKESEELRIMQDIVHGLIQPVGIYMYGDSMEQFPTESFDTGYEIFCNEEFLFYADDIFRENYIASRLAKQLLFGDTFIALVNYATGYIESIDPTSKSFRILSRAILDTTITCQLEQAFEEHPELIASTKSYDEMYNYILDESIKSLIDNTITKTRAKH